MILQDADNCEAGLKIFNTLYSEIFIDFDRFWCRQQNASFMNFNTIIVDFVNKRNHFLI